MKAAFKRLLLTTALCAPGMAMAAGNDLTMTNPVFQTNDMNVLKSQNGAGGATCGQSKNAISTGNTYTIEGYIERPASPAVTGAEIFVGSSWESLGFFDTSGVASFNAGANSNSKINDGVARYFAVVGAPGSIGFYLQTSPTTLTLVGNDTSGSTVPASSVMQIGCNPDGNNWKGEVSNVSIWNVARYAGTTAPMPTKMPAGNENGLLAYWPMNGDGTDASLAPSGGGTTIIQRSPGRAGFSLTQIINNILAAYLPGTASPGALQVQTPGQAMVGSPYALHVGYSPVNVLGTTTGGSTTATVSSTAGLFAGQMLGGNAVYLTSIVGVNSANSTITLSRGADDAENQTPWTASPTQFDYSTDGGSTWTLAPAPVIYGGYAWFWMPAPTAVASAATVMVRYHNGTTGGGAISSATFPIVARSHTKTYTPVTTSLAFPRPPDTSFDGISRAARDIRENYFGFNWGPGNGSATQVAANMAYTKTSVLRYNYASAPRWGCDTADLSAIRTAQGSTTHPVRVDMLIDAYYNETRAYLDSIGSSAAATTMATNQACLQQFLSTTVSGVSLFQNGFIEGPNELDGGAGNGTHSPTDQTSDSGTAQFPAMALAWDQADAADFQAHLSGYRGAGVQLLGHTIVQISNPLTDFPLEPTSAQITDFAAVHSYVDGENQPDRTQGVSNNIGTIQGTFSNTSEFNIAGKTPNGSVPQQQAMTEGGAATTAGHYALDGFSQAEYWMNQLMYAAKRNYALVINYDMYDYSSVYSDANIEGHFGAFTTFGGPKPIAGAMQRMANLLSNHMNADDASNAFGTDTASYTPGTSPDAITVNGLNYYPSGQAGDENGHGALQPGVTMFDFADGRVLVCATTDTPIGGGGGTSYTAAQLNQQSVTVAFSDGSHVSRWHDPMGYTDMNSDAWSAAATTSPAATIGGAPKCLEVLPVGKTASNYTYTGSTALNDVALNLPPTVSAGSGGTFTFTYAPTLPTGISYSIDGGSYTAASGFSASGGTGQFAAPTGLSQGSHYIQIRAAGDTTTNAIAIGFQVGA